MNWKNVVLSALACGVGLVCFAWFIVFLVWLFKSGHWAWALGLIGAVFGLALTLQEA
jgi:hypothetical protein